MTFACAVCEATEAFEIVTYAGYPACLVPLPVDVARTVERVPLTLAACVVCGHMQVPFVDPHTQHLLYDVYYSYYQVDGMETMLPVYRDPFNSLVTELAENGSLPKGRLLEIGCSSGAMVPFLSRISESYTGVDPSTRIELARAAHPDAQFVRDYFPSAQLDGTFDVIVTQFNLEHIEAAGAFIDAARALSRDGSVLLIQVPDAGYYLRTRQPNFIAHEHVQYFRRAQLERLLQLRGFEPIAWGEEGASLICAARATNAAQMPAENDPLRDARELRTLIATIPDLPRGAIFYGVGLTLHWLLVSRPALAENATVVDDNRGYHGFGVPGTNLIIEPPGAELFASGRDIILTLNEIYHRVVLERIRATGATNRIHRIAEGRWISEQA